MTEEMMTELVNLKRKEVQSVERIEKHLKKIAEVLDALTPYHKGERHLNIVGEVNTYEQN